jgi:hypothetical protein
LAPTSSQVALKIKLYFFSHFAVYEFLCIVKAYSIGIPKSETLSDPRILDMGY